MSPKRSRRDFFKMSAGSVVSATALAALGTHPAWADDDERRHRRHDGGRRSDYGDVKPKEDQNGEAILALPKGFEYVTFSKIGDAFGAGLTVPRNHDGMTCFGGRGNLVRLIRNHELRNAAGDFTNGVNGPLSKRYDAKGMGGCMTLDFDTRHKRLVRQFISIGGTIVNCAGGLSYRDAGWITCEETTAGPAQGYDKTHGYNFLVPASANSTVEALALTQMGRFAHEASVADEKGIVYQTEDAGNNSGFYRFIPNDPWKLHLGGKLQMLKLKDAFAANLFSGQTVGARLAVEWVDIASPDADPVPGMSGPFAQGRGLGGAAFNRLEGIFRGEDGRSIYFLSTSGGDNRGADGDGYGQLWHYIPADHLQAEDQLVLVFESESGAVLESPDNLCLTPRGGALFCEDDAVSDDDTHPLAVGITDVNRLVGLGARGEPFIFSVNLLNDSEFAGACFSPDGEVLFVNLFGDGTPGSGMTCAIWGPWEQGPL